MWLAATKGCADFSPPQQGVIAPVFWGLSFERWALMVAIPFFLPLYPAPMPSRSKSVSPASEAEGLTFEQSMEELESIIEALDGGPQGLDELVAKYERGMGLLARCQQQLEVAQLRIEQITRRADGSAEITPLSPESPPPARSTPSLPSPPPVSPSDEIRLF